MASGFECSLLELDLMGDALGMDVRPFPFLVPVHGDQSDDRRRLVGVARDSLAAKGLLDDTSFAPEVRRLLGLFAHGRLAIAMLGTTRNRPHRVRAVIDGAAGVIAVQRRELMRFAALDSDSAVRLVVGVLPAMRPGPGGSVTFTGSDAASTAAPAQRGRREEDDFSARSYLEVARPPATSAVTQQAVAKQILRRPRLGSGYIAVTARGRNGREGEPMTVSWLDTDAGRYAVIPSTSSDGRLNVTYTPADLGKLEQCVSRLVAVLS